MADWDSIARGFDEAFFEDPIPENNGLVWVGPKHQPGIEAAKKGERRPGVACIKQTARDPGVGLKKKRAYQWQKVKMPAGVSPA